ncbi:MAG TPA: trypsin-like peptidase domain-containing protein [Acidimicrobiales bacterium]|nr:trypsin-like peptidase domain-containing protein [Acidimicrobiales bacterium]
MDERGTPVGDEHGDEHDDDVLDDGPAGTWLPPDDRLWRHPSELSLVRGARERANDARPTPWTVSLLGGAIGAMLVTGSVAAAGGFRTHTVTVVERVAAAPPASGPDAVVNASRSTTAAPMGIPEIAERVRPAIVQVEVVAAGGSGSASGVLFRTDGHVLTNNHVIDGARSIVVVGADGKKWPATVVGGDAETDIAVLKISAPNVTTAVLGSAEGLKVGQLAIAIGSPLGLAGGPSVSVGVVSALARQVESNDGQPLLDMIQTDAPIAPGSSGGALLDSTGVVIGITTAIAVDSRTGAEGLGFATPIDIARDVADQLIAHGRVVHVWLGVDGEDVDQALADELGIPHGALVKRVRKGSPADSAGLVPGDVIVTMDGKHIASMAGLVVNLRSRRPGDVVGLTVRRGTRDTLMKARLSERPRS